MTRVAASDPVMATLGVAALVVVSTLLGVSVHGAKHNAAWRHGWWFLGLGFAMLSVANATTTSGSTDPAPFSALGWTLSGVITIAAAVARMLRLRLPGRAIDTAWSAALAAAAVAFLGWLLLATPDGVGGASRGLALAIPMFGIISLWLLARLVSLTGNYPAAYRYLVFGGLCLFTVHVGVAASALSGGAIPLARLEALELWGYCLFAASVLHPSLREPFEPVPPRAAPPAAAKVAMLAAVAVVGPAGIAARAALVGDAVPAALLVSAALPLLVVAHLVRQVYERAGAEYRAQHDALTGLPNRALFHGRLDMALSQARRSRRRAAVLFLDLDRFKNVNDSLGHDVGNVLLQAVAHRLQGLLRGEDTVARFGGDEFVVMLPDIATIADAELVAAKVLGAFEEPFNAAGRQFVATTSVGVAAFPDHGSDRESLLKNADTAMYRAKAAGRGRSQVYTTEMSARARVRHSLETNLHAALDRSELVLHYQPKVSLTDLSVTGVEALARWHHPRLGFISPGAFIPVAEESGLIIDLGEWVLEEACRQGQEWRSQGIPVVPIAVNMSARHFTQQDVPALVASILERTGFDPTLLELELTESVFLRNIASTAADLHRLHAMGVQSSIDDFGTGFSGLQYLASMPMNALKIDRAFVAAIGEGETDVPLVQAVIALAHSLGMAVIAEGVETFEQAQCLRGLGCEQMQGYLVSKALPGEQMADLLRLETTPGGAVRALAADLLHPSADDAPVRGLLDSKVLHPVLLAACSEDAEVELDLDAVTAVLRALQAGEPRSAERSWSSSVPLRLAAGTLAGLVPVSGGMAAAGALPAPVQTAAAHVLASAGFTVPAPARSAPGLVSLLAAPPPRPGSAGRSASDAGKRPLSESVSVAALVESVRQSAPGIEPTPTEVAVAPAPPTPAPPKPETARPPRPTPRPNPTLPAPPVVLPDTAQPNTGPPEAALPDTAPPDAGPQTGRQTEPAPDTRPAPGAERPAPELPRGEVGPPEAGVPQSESGSRPAAPSRETAPSRPVTTPREATSPWGRAPGVDRTRPEAVAPVTAPQPETGPPTDPLGPETPTDALPDGPPEPVGEVPETTAPPLAPAIGRQDPAVTPPVTTGPPQESPAPDQVRAVPPNPGR